MSIGSISNLSPPAKAGLAVLAGGGILGFVAALTGGNPTVLLIVTAGLALVALLLLLYKFILGWIRKRKAAPLERGILNNSSVSPNAISEPARRARLDDLRRSFEGGVEKFKASGKNIYSLPWYALVGEPGSGKTEAIRHCNVGFPPGLQDQLQGAGGTLNMNWWFTNHAIILDTAGRLMFEEVEPGGTSEWKEFLTLLTRVRPNCPINGMLLVIPADSLIRDTADSIERKAGKIAQQLDSIQRSLGVRFPVFVVVTKCDLINGFREFFDNLTDPQLRDQIVGWSNPAGLDQGFSAELVEKHLESVATQLARRRQGLLLDPVNTEDPNARRIDQVDALYSFPESLLKIGPRLRKYLETIFVTGEWSPKPLFLRGIYFTSSMREGSALDAELAEALKVPIESLPEGKVWERDRSFFLKDVFVQKVFKEKGLVTRASDTKKLQRRRKMAVMMTGILGILVLMGITWWGSRTLDRTIGEQKEYWTDVNDGYNVSIDKWQIVSDSKPYIYKGDEEAKGLDKMSRGDFHAKTSEMLEKRIDVPWIFKPLAMFSGEINDKRNDAYRAMYEKSVLRPLVHAARDKMRSESAIKWDDRATLALAQLIRIETYAAQATPATNAKDPAQEAINLEPLARYVIEDEDKFRLFKDKHAGKLQKSTKWLYTKEEGGGTWPPAGIDAKSTSNGAQALTHGVRTFNEYWSQQVEGRSERRLAMTKLIESLEKFRQAETVVKQATVTAPETKESFERFKGNWQESFATMKLARTDADTAVATLEKNNGWVSSRTLADLFDAEVTRTAEDAEKAHLALIDHLPAGDKSPGDLVAIAKTLSDALKRIPDVKQKALTAEQRTKTISLIDQLYLTRGQDLQKKESRRYAIHYQVYELADRQMAGTEPAPGVNFGNIAEELRKIDNSIEIGVVRELDTLLSGFTIGKEPVTEACNSAKAVADFAAREKRYSLIMLALKAPPKDGTQVAKEIALSEVAKNAPPEAVSYSMVPLTAFEINGKFPPEYYPEAAVNYINGWKLVGAKIAESTNKPRGGVLSASEVSALYDKTRKAIEGYQDDYVRYWREDLRQKLAVAPMPAWDRIFAAQALKAGQWEVRALANIQDIDDKAHKALEQIRATLSPSAAQALALQAPLSPREYARLEERSRLIVARWRALGGDAQAARLTVNGLRPEVFKSAYIFPDDQQARLPERYVAEFSTRMVEALALEAGNIARKAFDNLRKLDRFPLARPAKGAGVLTMKDIEDARGYLSQIKLDPNAGAAAAAPIAGDLDKVDQHLRTLRGLELEREDQVYLQRVEAVLKMLPKNREQLRCTISFLSEAEYKTHAAAVNKDVPLGAYPYGELIQATEVPVGKWPNGRELTAAAAPKSFGTVVCPGEPVRFRLSRFATFADADNPYVWPPVGDQDYNSSAPWCLLRLLHGENVLYRSEDGRVWHVELPVEPERQNQKGSSFWLKLEFDIKAPGIPDLREWPEKKAKP